MTDNRVFEVCFYKGRSNSQKLNVLVLKLILGEMGKECILNFIYVAGTRMKRAGIDGLS